MQFESDSKNSPHPGESPLELHSTSSKNQVHPQKSLEKDEKTPLKNENNLLNETPLLRPNTQNEKWKFSSHEIKENKRPLKREQRTEKLKELRQYQTNLLPEGVSSAEKLLDIYEIHRKKKKFGALREYPNLHTGGIKCVEVTADEKYIITGSSDKSIKIVDFDMKQEIHHFLNAHEGCINSICITPDGQFLLSGSDDKSIKLWNLRTKQLIHHFKNAHKGKILTIKLSRDGKFVFSGSEDGSVKIFNIQTFQQINHFEGLHERQINSIATTPNDRILVTGSDDFSVAVFDLQAKKLIHRFEKAHDGAVSCVTTSRDGQFIISGGKDSSIRIFDIEKRKEIHQFQWIQLGTITSLVVSPNGRYLVSSAEDCFVHVFDMEKLEPLHYYRPIDERFQHEIVSTQGSINAVAVTSDGRYIVTGSEDKSVKLLNMELAQRVHTFLDNENVLCVKISPNEKFLITSSEEKSIKVYDLQAKKQLHHFKNAHEGAINALAVARNNKFLISCSGDKSIKIWDLEEFKEVHHFKDTHSDIITAITVTPCGRFLISSSRDMSFKVFNIETKEQVYYEKDPDSDIINTLLVTPDGRHLIAGCRKRRIRIFDRETYKVVYTFENAHRNASLAIAVTPDNKYLASGSDDGDLKVFDLTTKQEFCCFESKSQIKDEVLSVATLGKNFIIAGYLSGLIRIFDFETKELVHSIPKAHHNPVQSVAVTNDGRYLVSGSKFKSVKIFCLRPEEERIILNHSAEVSALTITPDCKSIISAGEDRKIKFFDVSTQKEIDCLENVYHSTITSVVISQDNRFLVSCSTDRRLKIFNMQTRKEISCLDEIHEENQIKVGITPDSKYIVTGSHDKSIKIFDIQTRQLIHCFKDDSAEPVLCLALTSDSRFIVAGYRNSIKIFDIVKKQEVHHFKEAHQSPCVSIAVTNDNRHIVSGSEDCTVKIFDLQSKQLIHHFEKEHEGTVNAVAVTPDSRYFVSGSRDGLKVFDIESRQMVQYASCQDNQFSSRQRRNIIKQVIISPDGRFVASASKDSNIRITKLEMEVSDNLEDLKQETFLLYNGMEYRSFFNCIDNFLFESELDKSKALKYQELVIHPYGWTILHILALQGRTAFIKELPELSSQLKMPFLLDHFNKTPLHYLIANRKIDFGAVNSMFSYICSYLEDCYLREIYEFQEILKSLTLLLPFILNKIEVKLKERFLTLCFASSPVSYNEELPLFGQASSKSCFYEHPVIDEKSKSRIWKDGEAQVNFQTNFLYLDYNANSQDMPTMIELMRKQKNEDFFKLPLISKLMDHLWAQTQPPLILSFIAFSIFMCGLSIYLCLKDRNLVSEIVLLALSGLFILMEGLQIYDLGKDYLRNFWNWLDLSHLFLTVAFLITRLADNEDELARAWISTIIVLLGYLRWVSYLRIFQATRNLIQVILTIAKDMVSFVVIIAMIIFGFSIVFLVFERENEYGIYLYNTYSILYGPLDIEDDAKYSVSLKLIMVVIAFLLNVLLLNLLISIMGDSYDKILEKRDKTDALTRLEMMSEAMTYMKFLKVNYKSKRGYLLYCLSMDVEEDENAPDEWEGRINVMKKLLKQNAEETKDFKEKTEKMVKDLNKKVDDNQEMLKRIFAIVQENSNIKAGTDSQAKE